MRLGPGKTAAAAAAVTVVAAEATEAVEAEVATVAGVATRAVHSWVADTSESPALCGGAGRTAGVKPAARYAIVNRSRETCGITRQTEQKEGTMPSENSSFEDVQHELHEACAFLHAFSQGHRGFTRRDGLAGIERLAGLCEQMETSFTSGPNAQRVKLAMASAREHIAEAKARLALLRT